MTSRVSSLPDTVGLFRLFSRSFFCNFRVGRSITPPNALVSPATNSTMPTAAAVAAAAATAKIQALDAVASNAVLGLSATTPALGISPLAAAKVGTLPLSAGTNAFHPSITLPATTGPAFLAASIFQNPNVNTNLLTATASTLQAVTTQAINSANKTIIGTPPGVTVPIASKIGSTVPEGLVTVPQPVTASAVLAKNLVSGAVQPEIVKIAHEKQQEELQKKFIEEGETQTLQQQENMSIKGQSARQFVMQRLMRPQESRVIILRNMVGPEDVDETLQEEIQEECTKFGTVSRVIIFNEKQTENEDDEEAEIIVKIFVEFSLASEADRGKDALHGRFFGGRRVIAELYDQSLFDHGDLSG